MHVRRHAGQLLDFGTSGSLWNDALVMYDRQTGSYWSHVLGEALEGPLEGTKLRAIPATVTTFAEWVKAHPHTQVLKKGADEGRSSHYDRYGASERQGIFGTQARRRELDPKALVQGVALDGDAVAIALDTLEEGGTVTFELASLPLAAIRSGSAISIWKRRVAERLLRLETVADDPDQLRDRETGTVWNAMTGEGVSGSLSEHALEAVPSTTAYWFGWLNFYPQARLIR